MNATSGNPEIHVTASVCMGCKAKSIAAMNGEERYTDDVEGLCSVKNFRMIINTRTDTPQ